MKTFLRLVGLVRPFFWWMLLAAIAGFAATGSGIGLLMTSAYIIAKAALQPPMSDIQLGMAGVRFFGIARGAFRYAERLISHDATFRILARLRLWFYDALEPLAPARLLAFRSGDLLQRIVDDIQSLENIYARVLAPPVTALLTALLIWFLIGIWSPGNPRLPACGRFRPAAACRRARQGPWRTHYGASGPTADRDGGFHPGTRRTSGLRSARCLP